MGSKNCPETPRQKMINVMYLVLTAMLALNVDKSVLDAFYVVDNGLAKTIENFEGKNSTTYGQFDAAYQANPTKVQKYKDSADKIKQESDKLFKYLAEMKTYLIKNAEGPEWKEGMPIEKKDDTHIAAEVMIFGKQGTEIKKKIANYRKILISQADGNESMIENLNKSLNTSNPPRDPETGATPTWETEHFEGYPLLAVITLMTKMQSDVRNAEADMLKYLYAQIDAGSFKFNKLEALVFPRSNYVLEGDQYSADIFLAASDTTELPNIRVGGTQLKLDASGKGKYNAQAKKVGKHTFSGTIKYKMPDGTIKPFPFKSEYEVAKPTATISPTKMNVFYMGVENPVSISVPGVRADQVHPSITNGSIKQVKDKTTGNVSYVVRPKKVGKSVVNVMADLNGKKQKMGFMNFRVKKVPDPIATIASKNGGLIAKNVLISEQGVMAELPDFDFDLKFKVQSFIVSTTKGAYTVDEKSTSNRFTKKQMELMKGLSRGKRVYIDNILAKGEDGTIRKLASISFKIN